MIWMPRADSNGDLLIQSQACCRLHHEAWWACEESNPLAPRTPGLRPGADPTLQHARFAIRLAALAHRISIRIEMDLEGIAPSFPVCDAGVLLLDDKPGGTR